VISVQKLTKCYGPARAVSDLSFEVPRGQVVGFLGPNGAGKSTTMKMLACYLPPTSGTATLNGFDIFNQSEEVREHLGYLPESCPLYTEMKVQEYLDFRGRLRKMPRDQRRKRIDFVCERCWLTPVRGKTISHLSKGYRQRVGLADALLHDPAVLILDEPTVGLDPTQIRESRKLIKELGGDHTVMLSTHILPEVEAVCDRAIVIAGGQIVAQGTPDELRTSARASSRIRVECSAPTDEFRRAVKALAGVNDVEIVDDGARNGLFLAASIRTDGTRDLRDLIARVVADRHWPLRELRLEQASLEEFFIQVTANQATTQNSN
jgi:ABC-2 type transport system ATP-binding protein